MNKKKNKKDIIKALKELKKFRIKKNYNKVNLDEKNPGWEESEENYLKSQKDWLEKVSKKKK
ncbi:MAG: hypothetical protein RBR53_06430 [Desulforegulaceae bacterium]|nr:hypothetical protein [Desulforegulaceae bacterium]